MQQMKWQMVPVADAQTLNGLCASLGVREDVAQLLAGRGITDYNEAKAFFRPSLERLHDPFLMKNMDKAVSRLEEALGNGERILVYGDYDVDGTTSVALVYNFLKELGQVDFYIPDRYTEGYGLSFKGIDHAHANGFSLIITLDCGIRAVEKVGYANGFGIDIIICDHHLPGPELPAACAILDPKQPDCPYPYKELSGCGVGFKLLQAYCQCNGEDAQRLYDHLDLVAVSIAADIVPITGENRILATFGLEKLNRKPSLGIRAMLEYTKLNRELTISDVVFVIAPRINAAGRIASGRRAVELLVSTDLNEALDISALIADHNTERRDLDKSVTEQALQLIAEDEFYRDSRSTVVFHEEWHKGVVGIVASRLIEKYYKPTIVLTCSEGKATGSARSVNGFDVHAALVECEDLLEQFGGHMHAAGMSLPLTNVEAFRQRFEAVVAQRIKEEHLQPVLRIDLQLDLDRITPKFMELLKQFAPFGPGNLSPVFVTKGLTATEVRVMGSDGTHVRFQPKQAGIGHLPLQAVAFKMGELAPALESGKPFDMAYSIEENHWKDRVYLQLNVKEIKFR